MHTEGAAVATLQEAPVAPPRLHPVLDGVLQRWPRQGALSPWGPIDAGGSSVFIHFLTIND